MRTLFSVAVGALISAGVMIGAGTAAAALNAVVDLAHFEREPVAYRAASPAPVTLLPPPYPFPSDG